MGEHPICCDCDRCLNGSGGYVLPGAGKVVPTPGASRRRYHSRLKVDARRSELLRREELAADTLRATRRELRSLP
jgi:hypothetical protein